MPVGAYGDDSRLDARVAPRHRRRLPRSPISGATGLEREDLAGRSGAARAVRESSTATARAARGARSETCAACARTSSTTTTVEARQHDLGSRRSCRSSPARSRYWGEGKLRYAVHLHFARETVAGRVPLHRHQRRGRLHLSSTARSCRPPSLFNPIETNVPPIGVRAVHGLPDGPGDATLALGIRRDRDNAHPGHERTDALVLGDQRDRARSASGRRRWSAASAGRSSTGWTSRPLGELAQQDWRFTTSAGVGAIPLSGSRQAADARGEGQRPSTRAARWTQGKAHLAGRSLAAATRHRPSIRRTPNDADFVQSLPLEAFNRAGRGHARAAGQRRATTSRRATPTAGAEARAIGSARPRRASSTIGCATWAPRLALGSGPRRIAWDVRVGLEHPLGEQMQGRIGYIHRWVDQDDYTAGTSTRASARRWASAMRRPPRRGRSRPACQLEWPQSRLRGSARARTRAASSCSRNPLGLLAFACSSPPGSTAFVRLGLDPGPMFSDMSLDGRFAPRVVTRPQGAFPRIRACVAYEPAPARLLAPSPSTASFHVRVWVRNS